MILHVPEQDHNFPKHCAILSLNRVGLPVGHGYLLSKMAPGDKIQCSNLVSDFRL